MNTSNPQIAAAQGGYGVAALPSPKYVFAARTKWCIVEMSSDGWINQPATPPEKIFDTYHDAKNELSKMNNLLMVILEMSISYHPAFQ